MAEGVGAEGDRAERPARRRRPALVHDFSTEERRLLVSFIAHLSSTERRAVAESLAEGVVARIEEGVSVVQGGSVVPFDPAPLLEYALRWRRGERVPHPRAQIPPEQRWRPEDG